MIFDDKNEKPFIVHNWSTGPLPADRARNEMIELLEACQRLGMMFVYQPDAEGGNISVQMLPGMPSEPALRLLHSDGNERMLFTWTKMMWHCVQEWKIEWTDPWINWEESDEDLFS